MSILLLIQWKSLPSRVVKVPIPPLSSAVQYLLLTLLEFPSLLGVAAPLGPSESLGVAPPPFGVPASLRVLVPLGLSEPLEVDAPFGVPAPLGVPGRSPGADAEEAPSFRTKMHDRDLSKIRSSTRTEKVIYYIDLPENFLTLNP